MAFTRGDYVVRTGWRSFWLLLLGVLGWTVLMVGVWLTGSRGRHGAAGSASGQAGGAIH
jgi:hypothetical protein